MLMEFADVTFGLIFTQIGLIFYIVFINTLVSDQMITPKRTFKRLKIKSYFFLLEIWYLWKKNNQFVIILVLKF